MGRLKSEVKGALRKCKHLCIKITALKINRQVKIRNLRRDAQSGKWLLPEEQETAKVLLNLIVPSDTETPGVDDIDVLGPSAIEVLDKLIARRPERQVIYARGLLCFDIWAREVYGRAIGEIDVEGQLNLVSSAEMLWKRTREGRSVFAKVRNPVAEMIVHARGGRLFAAELFNQIRNDCLRIFYTSRVGWIWLEYDGPPMDEGYPKLSKRH